MRNMLQLLGGVAVAGAVAAGTTAFTGSGLTSTVTPADSFIGGTATVTVSGSTLDGVDYTYTDVATTKKMLHAIVLHFADTTSAGAAVTLTTSVTGGSNPTWTCGVVTSQASTCTASADYDITTGTVNSYAIHVA